jgi:hypothetical protein
MTYQKSQYLMGLDLRRRSGLPNASAFAPHQAYAYDCCFYMVLLAFLRFFLRYNRGNLQYGSPSFHLSKEISLQTHVLPVMAIFGWSWLRSDRPATEKFLPLNTQTACQEHAFRETSRNGPLTIPWRDYFCGKRHIKQIRIK